MIATLPDDLLVHLFSACDPDTLRSIALTCTRFLRVIRDDFLWEAVFVKTMGAKPMCRLSSTWRGEVLKRKRLLAPWRGLQRSLSCCTIPQDIGRIVRADVISDEHVLFVGEDGLLRLDATSKKRSVFYYSTMFSEAAVLSAAAFNSKQLVFGFSDGSIVVVRGLPEKDWSDCDWYTLCRSGPPIIKLTCNGKLLLSVGQRAQSEMDAFAQVFSLKTKGRLQSKIISNYSFCDLEADGSIFTPSHPTVQRKVSHCQVASDCIYRDGTEFPIEYRQVFSNSQNIILLRDANELTFFSPECFSVMAQFTLKTSRISDIYVLNEVIIVAALDCVLILDAVGGSPIAKRNFKNKGNVKIVWAAHGIVYFSNGNEFTVLSIKDLPPSSPPSHPAAAKKKSLEAKEHSIRINDGMDELHEEKKQEKLLDRLRSRMNIEGLSEAELVQYAQLLSLEKQ